MKPTCRHSWKFSHQEPHRDDRIIRHFKCRLCPKTSRRNVKKPRFTATLRRKPSLPSKPSKTPQERPVRKRKAIRKVSDKRKNWLKQYEAKKKAEGDEVTIWELFDPKYQRPFLAKTTDLKSRWKAEPHHPLGRVGCRVLFYVWVTPDLHRYLHANGEIARSRGWILPEMSGRTSGPEQPDPFNILPEYRAYMAEHGLH